MGSLSFSDTVVSTPTTPYSGEDDDNYSLPSFTKGNNPDFVLVWDDSNKKSMETDSSNKRLTFERNLEEEGLILEEEIIGTLHAVKLWAPLEVLKRYSEILKLRLPMKVLDMNVDKKPDRNSANSHETLYMKKSSSTIVVIGPVLNHCKRVLSLNLDPDLFPKKGRRLTGVYSRDKEYLFDVEESNMHEIFPISVRSRIVQYILKWKTYRDQKDTEHDNISVGYERLVKKHVYEAAYPLHDGTLQTVGSTRKLLGDTWAKYFACCKYQPLDTIKDYFGVNVALYFAWLGYYSGMLSFATVFGMIIFFYGLASISGDQYVQDICNATANITMCPLCDGVCRFEKLDQRCGYSKLAHLFDNEGTIVFAIVMSIWAAVFLERWSRYAAWITHRWDLSNFDVRDFHPRPEYMAKLKKFRRKGIFTTDSQTADEKSEKETLDFDSTIPTYQKLPFKAFSVSSVLLLIFLAGSAVIGVIIYRLWFTFWLSKLSRHASNSNIGYMRTAVGVTGALLNLAFIVIFGKMYEKIALKLTEIEIPRTQAEFDASYTLKVYVLQFINNYSSIFYVAFFKGAYSGDPHKYHKLFGFLRQEECGISCMPELSIQLAIIMIGKQAKSMAMEFLMPMIKRKAKKAYAKVQGATKKHHEDDDDDPPNKLRSSSRKQSLKSPDGNCQWLEDYDLLEWDHFLLTDEYLEMVLQFGFVTIFVTAFPLAPLFALLNNLLELRVDAKKMLAHYRRPVGIRVKDIGVWSSIVAGVVKIAILSNACIIAITSNFIPKMVYRYIILEKNDTNYGTLNGYLNDSLTIYDTADLDSAPDNSSEKFCNFATYRNDYDAPAPEKYEFRTAHWQIWLARIVFIIIYENVVAVLIIVLRWLIPDVPDSLMTRIQREQRKINDLIMKHELLRAPKTRPFHSVRRVHSPTVQPQHQELFENSKNSARTAHNRHTP